MMSDERKYLELQAYFDGELDEERTLQVENKLCAGDLELVSEFRTLQGVQRSVRGWYVSKVEDAKEQDVQSAWDRLSVALDAESKSSVEEQSILERFKSSLAVANGELSQVVGNLAKVIGGKRLAFGALFVTGMVSLAFFSESKEHTGLGVAGNAVMQGQDSSLAKVASTDKIAIADATKGVLVSETVPVSEISELGVNGLKQDGTIKLEAVPAVRKKLPLLRPNNSQTRVLKAGKVESDTNEEKIVTAVSNKSVQRPMQGGEVSPEQPLIIEQLEKDGVDIEMMKSRKPLKYIPSEGGSLATEVRALSAKSKAK